MKLSLRWLFIIIACLSRFAGLHLSPPGFYIDEAMGAAHSLCYQQTGHDLFSRIGLFSKIDFGGFQSAPFILSGALWTEIFGPSAVGFRSFIAFVGCLTVLAVYRLVINLTGDRERALWATVFAAALPWAFQFSRISWDAPLATCFLVGGLAVLYAKPPRDQGWRKFLPPLAAGFLVALASYTYAPMRLNALILLVFLPGVSYHTKVLVVATFTLLNVPVLPYYADAEFIARSKLLALTSDYEGNPFRHQTALGLALAYATNVFRHLSPSFLLLRGDANIRHSIQTFGMLDGVTYFGVILSFGFGIVSSIKRRSFQTSLLFRLSLVGVFAGLTPAALTWEGVPHAIRAMGAWPFFTLLAADGWSPLLRKWKHFRFALGVASTICFALYLRSYFTTYPKMASIWFDEPLYMHIMKTRDVPSTYGAVARAYYRMAVRGESCAEIQKEFRR